MLGLGCGALVIAIVLACLITRSITRPINDAASIATAVAAGDLTRCIEVGSLEETAASMEELTSTVKQNADNASQANALAH